MQEQPGIEEGNPTLDAIEAPEHTPADPATAHFLDEVAASAGIDRERAFEATGVVLCTMLYGVSAPLLHAIQSGLPYPIARILDEGPSIRGNSVPLVGMANIVHAIANRMDVPFEEAKAYTHAVADVTSRYLGGGEAGAVMHRLMGD